MCVCVLEGGGGGWWVLLSIGVGKVVLIVSIFVFNRHGYWKEFIESQCFCL